MWFQNDWVHDVFAAEGSDLSLTALSYEGGLDGAPLSVTHAGAVPAQTVIGTVAFPGGTERGLARYDSKGWSNNFPCPFHEHEHDRHAPGAPPCARPRW